MKNPSAPAGKREVEEDWGRGRAWWASRSIWSKLIGILPTAWTPLWAKQTLQAFENSPSLREAPATDHWPTEKQRTTSVTTRWRWPMHPWRPCFTGPCLGSSRKKRCRSIVDEAGALLFQGNPIAMRQALQTLRWFRQDIGIEGPTTEG